MSKDTSERRRHRSFTAKGSAPTDPVTFDLDGTEFTCHAQVPGAVILEHSARLLNRRTATRELLTIWEDVFDQTREIDEDGNEVPGTSEYDRFMAYVRDPSHEIDVQMLGEILQWVLGELAGQRPTEPSAPSRRGRSRTGGTSPSAQSVPEPDEDEDDEEEV